MAGGGVGLLDFPGQLCQSRSPEVARYSLVVRASDIRRNGLEFAPRPPHYRSVGTGMGDRLWAGMPSQYVTSHPGQLSLLRSMGREMSTGQSAVMRRGWEVKAGWLIPFVDKCVSGR